MNSLQAHLPLYKKILLVSTSLFSILVLTSACYCEDDQKKSAENNVLLLKFDQNNGDFTAGKEYSYFNDTETFTINLHQEELSDRTISTLHYAEMNALLFKAETRNEDVSGTINIPEDFKDRASFEHTDSNDLISAESYKVLTGEELDARDFEEMRLQIQSLSKVREYMKANPNQQVNILSYQPTAGKNPNNSQWLFVIKN